MACAIGGDQKQGFLPCQFLQSGFAAWIGAFLAKLIPALGAVTRVLPGGSGCGLNASEGETRPARDETATSGEGLGRHGFSPCGG